MLRCCHSPAPKKTLPCAKPEWLEPCCHFETAVPPGEAIRHAITAVQKVGATVTDIKPKKSKIKCSLLHNFSSVIFHITIFQASKGSGMYIMEFQRDGATAS